MREEGGERKGRGEKKEREKGGRRKRKEEGEFSPSSLQPGY